MLKYFSRLLFFASFGFVQAANYMNPNWPIETKLLATGVSLGVWGFALMAAEGNG